MGVVTEFPFTLYASLVKAQFTTIPFSAPSTPPDNIQVTALSPVSVAVSWDPPAQHSRNGFLHHYSLLIAAQVPWLHYQQRFEVNDSTQLNVTGLSPFVTYHIQINAHTVLAGPFSSEYSVTTLETGVYVFVCVCGKHTLTIRCVSRLLEMYVLNFAVFFL